MKNNVILTFILILLLGIAFLSEEVFKQDKAIKKKEISAVIKDLKNVVEIKTNQYHFIKNDNEWFEKNSSWPVDQELMKEVVKIFDSIESQGTVKKSNTNEYFNESKNEITFKTSRGNETYLIGNLSKVTGAFYISTKSNPREVKISYDRSHLGVPHKTEAELFTKKYNRFINLINSSKYNFFSQNLAHHLKLDIKKIDKVKIDNRINRWFEVNLKEKVTFPKVLGKMKYKKMGKILNNSFNGFQLKQIIEKGQNVLTNLSSTVNISGQKNFELKVYSALNGRFGKFLRINGHSTIYELVIPKISIFNLNVQDFWRKKIQYDADFTKLKKLNFSLSYNALKYYDFYVDDLEQFKVKSLEKQINFISKVHMNFLFNLILNLADFKDAKFVEQIYTNKVKEADLIVKLLGKTLAILINDSEIIVTDLTDQLKYHFDYDQKQIQKGFFDNIFTVKQK